MNTHQGPQSGWGVRFHSVSFRDKFSAVEMAGEEEKEIFCSRGFPYCTCVSPNRECTSAWHRWKANSSTALIFFFWGRGWEVFASPCCRTKSRPFSFMQKKEDTQQPTLQDSLYPMGRVLGCDMGDSHSNLYFEPGRALTIGLALWSFGAGETFGDGKKVSWKPSTFSWKIACYHEFKKKKKILPKCTKRPYISNL